MLVCCFVFAGVQAQKITRDYNNVSLSEALRQLNEQTEEYTISFLYNELEDFRITTSVHRKTVPDAIRRTTPSVFSTTNWRTFASPPPYIGRVFPMPFAR